jgi:tRNA U34 2-thiouridine synthase MnmA/TrmU
MKEKILVSLNGAENSFVTAWLLKKQGFHLRGVVFDITEDSQKKQNLRKSIADYERKLGISIQVMDCAREVHEIVEREISKGVEHGFRYDIKTIFHQRFLFPKLLMMREHFKFDKVATGHLVNIQVETHDQSVTVIRNPLLKDDETHLLVGMTQKELRFFEFPLGAIPKNMIHKLSEELKLNIEDTSILAKYDLERDLRDADSTRAEAISKNENEDDALSLLGDFVDSIVFDVFTNHKQVFEGKIEERAIQEIWLENASWFSGQDLGFKVKQCLMSWTRQSQPVPVKIMQYEGGGLKVLCDQPLTGENANIFGGDSVIWLDGELVLGGARVVQCL